MTDETTPKTAEKIMCHGEYWSHMMINLMRLGIDRDTAEKTGKYYADERKAYALRVGEQVRAECLDHVRLVYVQEINGNEEVILPEHMADKDSILSVDIDQFLK